MNGIQTHVFGEHQQLITPDKMYNLDDRILESKEIVNKAIIDTDPFGVGLMLSGGDDSVTALQVALMLGIKINFVLHGVTGTGLKDVRTYVNNLCAAKKIKLIEANAGNAYEDYVKRKGFFGVGKMAHTYSYHVLKSGPFESALSKHVRRNVKNRRIILLNGVRVEESDNRLDNFADNPYKWRQKNYWVNIIHWFTKNECLHLLESENVQRNPVSIFLNRSGECNCGTMQNEAARLACAEYDPEWKEWMWSLRKYAIQKFGWDIGQNPNKKALAEMKAVTETLSQDMPMCVGCKAKYPTFFDTL